MKKIASLSFAMLIACGGSSSDGAPDSPTNQNPPANPDAPAGACTGLPCALDTYAWADPPPADDVKSNATSVELTAKDANQNESVFECTKFDHDAHGVYDHIVWLSQESASVKPGLLLQGKAFRNGELSPVPVKRTPISLSVDLAVPTPTRKVDVPDSASIQDAIAKFQSEADALPDVPGNIQYTITEVTQKEEIALSLGVHASYSGLLASASLDADISHESGLTQHTVVASLVQPVYTVSFADDALPTAASFFDPSLTDADWKAQADSGTISPDNQPVFVSSVTYGRMVMVSLTSTSGQTADSIKTLVQGSTAAFSASAQLSIQQKAEWSTLKHEEFQRGGSANAASDAMTTGDFTKFFGKAAPSTMVPISFTVKTLNGTRKIARIGDLTHWSAADCATQGKWNAVTKVADGAFSKVGVGSNDEVYALSAQQPQKIFHFDKATSSFTSITPSFAPYAPENIVDLAVGRDGTVGTILEDHRVLVYRASAPTPWTVYEEGQVQFDAGNGSRPLNHIAVFDTDTFAFTNHEDISWSTNAMTNLNFENTGNSGLIGIDQFHKLWMAPTTGGVLLVDGVSHGQSWIGNLGVIDSLTVGAPNDVWITYSGKTYRYDASNNSSWTEVNMGTFMPIMSVGVDGHLWGIGPDGRINRWLGLRP
jgi:hypothetical protein